MFCGFLCLLFFGHFVARQQDALNEIKIMPRNKATPQQHQGKKKKQKNTGN